MKGARVLIHKLTIAPEVNPRDQKAFVREVMTKFERARGLDLEWFAVAHSNTEHHHVHMIVLGKDRNSTPVRLTLKDMTELKSFGDSFLERYHAPELERSKRKRNNRKDEHPTTRAQHGLELLEQSPLPCFYKKIVRE